jgi:hypothetical protein
MDDAGVECRGLGRRSPENWRQRRQQRQDESDRRVQPAELVVIGERQIQMHALNVGPSVPWQSKIW